MLSGGQGVNISFSYFPKLNSLLLCWGNFCFKESNIKNDNHFAVRFVFHVLKLFSFFTEEFKGSDIMLEAVLEAEVAHNAKEFFSSHQSQMKQEQE